jgi:hypothetical protein
VGGFGSGTWARLDSKLAVEEFLSLDVIFLARRGLLEPNGKGYVSWRRTRTRERIASAKVFCGPDLGSQLFVTVRL